MTAWVFVIASADRSHQPPHVLVALISHQFHPVSQRSGKHEGVVQVSGHVNYLLQNLLLSLLRQPAEVVLFKKPVCQFVAVFARSRQSFPSGTAFEKSCSP